MMATYLPCLSCSKVKKLISKIQDCCLFTNYGFKKGFFNSPLIFMINCIQNEVNNTTLINENDNEISQFTF